MMKESQLPIMLILSEKDKLVDSDISYEIAELIGASEDNFSVCNQYSMPDTERKSSSFPWVMVLPEGGHYSFKTFPKVVNEAVADFYAAAAKPEVVDGN